MREQLNDLRGQEELIGKEEELVAKLEWQYKENEQKNDNLEKTTE